MCGINGVLFLSHQPQIQTEQTCQTVLQLMNDTIAHRGPDSDGIVVKSPVGFGFRRLSIIDLSSSANQPMLSKDGQVMLIFNGEIYNYLEIKQQLMALGHTFRTDSDTEVILNSYLEYGESCIHHFNGMWAFAIYDFRKKRLFCSRDRLGVKPFYYCVKDQLLYFSSELKSLHAVLKLQQANLPKVYEYLAYGYRINDGETFFEDCYELLPGTNLLVEGAQLILHRYWKLGENLFQHDPALSFQEEYVKLFESAVKLRYRSDVPVALLLSGGLDSTSIAKVTDNLIQRGELSQNEIHAFIASFPGFDEDETPIAREFIKTCKNIHLHEMVIDSEKTVDDLENTIYALDHPVFSFNVVAHHNIMQACKQRGIKVVLNGQGSDEAFAGYDRYISGAYLVNQLISRDGNFVEEFKALNKFNGYSSFFLCAQMLKSVMNQRFSAYLRAKYQEKSLACLDPGFVKDAYDHYKPTYRFSTQGNNFTNYLLKQIKYEGLNQILHYEDVSSMSQSIEVRSPFMDYRMMEFAFSIPNDLKFKNGVTKLIQRQTIGKMLPKSITESRKKIGFRAPFVDYLSSDPNFKIYVSDMMNSQRFSAKKIWKANKIQHVFENAKQHPNFPFWRIINLEVWSKVYNITNL
ncbi:asparagine synthase (glutamine-hydrolyzing) [Haliscomenobacter hydrossis]|uniref:asparagine synthase (glutamine-hydrolyzing) n=1 Tax=Haliscomenobacter hydrossis (strain ATCC 27775 / DSM 1100 / LMG 10767 / O) TaxID=760192 RepID=F4KR27_HALH1|nr:asparagine synthase (glutamine-hydrolyzing) [Haliscomenobacter hydrossis]AEE53265.1 asparagine synthase (glutamine-hydrolyzing) [Haliscomenobacter hydrossis DSM 1100]